jgi:hypothetical protein
MPSIGELGELVAEAGSEEEAKKIEKELQDREFKTGNFLHPTFIARRPALAQPTEPTDPRPLPRPPVCPSTVLPKDPKAGERDLRLSADAPTSPFKVTRPPVVDLAGLTVEGTLDGSW